jgi:hypothetical protein
VVLNALSPDATNIHSQFKEQGAENGDHIFLMSMIHDPNRYYDMFDASYGDKISAFTAGYVQLYAVTFAGEVGEFVKSEMLKTAYQPNIH